MNTPTLKKSAFLITLSAVCAAAGAQEVGRVLSTTPVVQQFAVPRQVCTNQATTVQSAKSGGGAILGAIAGGAVGNQVGNGGGRALATAIGLIGGAFLGDRVEGSGGTEVQNVTQCTTQTFYENRPVAYNVVYEFGGKQYQVQLPRDPGPTIQLQVTPVGASTVPAAPAPLAVQPQPVYQQPVYVQPVTQYVVPETVVVTSPVVVRSYAPYYARPYYPPVGVSLNLGYSKGYGHYGHRHY